LQLADEIPALIPFSNFSYEAREEMTDMLAKILKKISEIKTKLRDSCENKNILNTEPVQSFQ
jgi:hypothetical protein